MGKRIIVDPKKFDSEPYINGTQVLVSMISSDIEQGLTIDEIMERYGEITKEDISAAYSFYLTGSEV
ncbi:MAG: DUF433 domain-containing protein [Leptospiraceae bacterium]|nr:DUF433 domain-containing protein [Leptospiraceae bacterium]